MILFYTHTKICHTTTVHCKILKAKKMTQKRRREYMALIRFKTDKLIRDKMLEIMQAENITVITRALTNDEFIVALKKKLMEEALEVHETSSPKELIEELADVYEVLGALVKAGGISAADIEKKRVEKAEKRGAFEKRIFNTFVELEENNPAINYYRPHPERYPEIKDPSDSL